MERKAAVEVTIDAADVHYRRLLTQLRELVSPEMNVEEVSVLNRLEKKFSFYTNFDAEGILGDKGAKLHLKHSIPYSQFYTY